MKAKDPSPTNQAYYSHDFRRTAGGAAEIKRTPANQASLRDFHDGGFGGGRGFPGSGRVVRHGGWGEGNSRRGGKCVSGYGNYHDLGGGKHQPPTGHGYPPPHHKASRGKRGGKREKERRQKRAKHGTTKPSDLSAEKPTNQPSIKPVRPQFADDSDTSSEDIGRRLARRKAAVKSTDQPSDLSAVKSTD
jgi:hypothetical protein